MLSPARVKEETDYEMHLRIKSENEKKEKRKSDRAIKKLKKEGKVQPIAGFLIFKEQEDDNWIRSKKRKIPTSEKDRNYVRTLRPEVYGFSGPIC